MTVTGEHEAKPESSKVLSCLIPIAFNANRVHKCPLCVIVIVPRLLDCLSSENTDVLCYNDRFFQQTKFRKRRSWWWL